MALIEIPQVLSIAGTDSSGGAGLNADTRVFALNHVYAATVVTGVTAQNTLGVTDIEPIQADMLTAQLNAVFSDLDIKAMKTGALFSKDVVETLVHNLQDKISIPLVVDPVMVAKGGAKLLSDDAVNVVKTKLLPLTYLVTPNIVEAELLADMSIKTKADMITAAKKMQSFGVKNVLIKGGHLSSSIVMDLLYTEQEEAVWYEKERVDTIRTHGTGDTLSAYVVAELAKGRALIDLMLDAQAYMTQVITQGINVGHGHGPLNHWAKS